MEEKDHACHLFRSSYFFMSVNFFTKFNRGLDL